jgi:hypothetical protein
VNAQIIASLSKPAQLCHKLCSQDKFGQPGWLKSRNPSG